MSTPPSVPVPPAPAPRLRITPEERQRARGLLSGFDQADQTERLDLLKALSREVGGVGLVMALDHTVPAPRERKWIQTQQVLDQLQQLGDPDMVDALAAWAAEPDRHPHWRGEAGVLLAEHGDLRAARILAARIAQPPEEIYDRTASWEVNSGGHLSKTDHPRSIAARMLADLALMRPGHRERLRREAEPAMVSWLQESRVPRANGMRFLGIVGGDAGLEALRARAFPKAPLPAAGAMPPFPAAYATAQPALRHLGRLREATTLPQLVGQLSRKPPGEDISQDALASGLAIAMRGLSLRCVVYGAANGLAEWGPEAGPDARRALVRVAEDPSHHEEAREAACAALAWTSRPPQLADLLSQATRFGRRADEASRWTGSCYATALASVAHPQLAPAIVDALLDGRLPRSLRFQLVRALALSGVTTAQAKRLSAPGLEAEVAGLANIAVLLGGSEADVLAVLDARGDDIGMRDDLYLALGHVTTNHLRRGAILRWVLRGRAAKAAGHGWLAERVRSQLDDLIFERGPHTITSNLLRYDWLRGVRNGKRPASDVIAGLASLGWRGPLMALARDRAPYAKRAQKALASKTP